MAHMSDRYQEAVNRAIEQRDRKLGNHRIVTGLVLVFMFIMAPTLIYLAKTNHGLSEDVRTLSGVTSQVVTTLLEDKVIIEDFVRSEAELLDRTALQASDYEAKVRQLRVALAQACNAVDGDKPKVCPKPLAKKKKAVATKKKNKTVAKKKEDPVRDLLKEATTISSRK